MHAVKNDTKVYYCYCTVAVCTTVGIRKPDIFGFRMVDLVWISNGVHLSNGSTSKKVLVYIKRSRLVKTIQKTDKNVRFSNGVEPTFKMSGFRMFPVFECPVFRS